MNQTIKQLLEPPSSLRIPEEVKEWGSYETRSVAPVEKFPEIEKEIREDVKDIYTSLYIKTFLSELDMVKKEIKKVQEDLGQLRKMERTKNIYIQNLRYPTYVLKSPISIALEFEENQVIASCYDIDMYGSGSNEEEAIDDLCEVIVEYYESLKEDKDKLGPIPRKHWIYLERIISEEK